MEIVRSRSVSLVVLVVPCKSRKGREVSVGTTRLRVVGNSVEDVVHRTLEGFSTPPTHPVPSGLGPLRRGEGRNLSQI